MEQFKSIVSITKKQRNEKLQAFLNQINATSITERMPPAAPVGVEKEMTPIQHLYHSLIEQDEQTLDLRPTATVHQFHMLFNNLFYVHKTLDPESSFISIFDGTTRTDVKCPDIDRWLRSISPAFINSEMKRNILHLDYDHKHDTFKLKSSCTKHENLHVNFVFKNKQCIFAHVVPSGPEFRIKENYGTTLVEQDYTICFVFANVAKIYVVRLVSNNQGSKECELIGSRLVLFKNEIS